MKLPLASTSALVVMLLLPAGADAAEKDGYHFDKKGIPRAVLENDLERAVTMAFDLVPEKPEGRRVYPHHGENARFTTNMGAEFIGLDHYRWGAESRLNSEEFGTKA